MNKELTSKELEELEFIKNGSTYFANDEGIKKYDLLLQIDKKIPKAIDFVYGNDLLEVMGVQHIDSYMGKCMLAGAILTNKGRELLRKEKLKRIKESSNE